MSFSAEYIDTLRNVANANLIRLWPLSETSAVNAKDLSLFGDDITSITSVTQGGWRMADKVPCALFDGLNDTMDNESAIATDLPAPVSDCTVLIWWKVNDAGVWSDGTDRDIFWLFADVSNLLTASKNGVADTMKFRLEIGADNLETSSTSYADLLWHCLVVRWSVGGGTKTAEMFMDGTSFYSPTPTADWSGTEQIGRASIGSFRAGNADFWSGAIGPMAIWNKELTDAEVAVVSKI
jgi:hypothetical protein